MAGAGIAAAGANATQAAIRAGIAGMTGAEAQAKASKALEIVKDPTKVKDPGMFDGLQQSFGDFFKDPMAYIKDLFSPGGFSFMKLAPLLILGGGLTGLLGGVTGSGAGMGIGGGMLLAGLLPSLLGMGGPRPQGETAAEEPADTQTQGNVPPGAPTPPQPLVDPPEGQEWGPAQEVDGWRIVRNRDAQNKGAASTVYIAPNGDQYHQYDDGRKAYGKAGDPNSKEVNAWPGGQNNAGKSTISAEDIAKINQKAHGLFSLPPEAAQWASLKDDEVEKKINDLRVDPSKLTPEEKDEIPWFIPNDMAIKANIKQEWQKYRRRQTTA
jgi:hypothetical protein